MLFGWNRLKPAYHYFSTICVAFGAHFSATWIVAANSWMQTPAGYEVVGTGDEARAILTDFWGMIFNPSFLDRLTHVLIGCWLTGAFMVISISAYYFLKKRHRDFARLSMKIALIVAVIMTLLQLVSADSTTRGVAKYQPAKLAAMEGTFQTEAKAPMNLIGWINTTDQSVHTIQIPALLSFLVNRNTDIPVTGLDNFDQGDWPMVNSVFQFYHLMIYMWGGMFLAALLGVFLWKRKKLEKSKWLNRYLVLSVIFPFIANEAGWFTAEMGRQPWVVYNVLRTSEGVSRSLDVGQVIGSLIMFSVMYICLFTLFIFLLTRKIKAGPEEETEVGGAVYTDPYQVGVT